MALSEPVEKIVLRKSTPLASCFVLQLPAVAVQLLESYADSISFFIPETAYAEAEEQLAALVIKRGGDPAIALRSLRSMAALGTIVSLDLYLDHEAEARKRLTARDPEDWPILPPRWRSVVRSGLRTRTSSGAVSRLGPPPASIASSRSSSYPVRFTQQRLARLDDCLVCIAGGGFETSHAAVEVTLPPIAFVAPLAADLDRAPLRLTA